MDGTAMDQFEYVIPIPGDVELWALEELDDQLLGECRVYKSVEFD